MNIGQLDRLLTIQTLTQTQNASFEWVPSNTTIGTIWARQNFTTGSEAMTGEKRTVKSAVEYLVRYEDAVEIGIDETCIILNDDGVYINVINIDEDVRYGRRNISKIIGEVRK